MKATVSGIAHTQQAGADDKTITELHSKMLDLHRDLTLQSIRIDKTATSVHDINCKLAA